MIYAQQVFGYGKAGDILWVLSCSGNSPNILTVKVARMLDMVVIGFTERVAELLLRLPDPGLFSIKCDSLYPEMHLPAYHLLCAMVEEEFPSLNTLIFAGSLCFRCGRNPDLNIFSYSILFDSQAVIETLVFRDCIVSE